MKSLCVLAKPTLTAQRRGEITLHGFSKRNLHAVHAENAVALPTVVWTTKKLSPLAVVGRLLPCFAPPKQKCISIDP
jgi:hypothetical protein